MSTLAKLVVKLVTDVTEFTSGLDKASAKLAKAGDVMAGIGDKMTVGVTLPIVAAGVAAVKFASDLNETKNKTEVVFGDMSQSVMDFAKSSARDLGMSQNAALQAASTFGNLFTSMGVGQDKAADMSTGLVQLAADLASFNNLDPSDVFVKLQSGIVGETEPLRALGVNLSAVAVEAKAMQMGLADANGDLSEQAKIMARYQLIMEQTGNAQGDFARTSDGLANSTRILKAQLEDTMASFGQVAIPVATQFLRAMIPILEFFNGLPMPVKTGIIYLLMFAAAIGPILSVGGRLVVLFTTISGLFGAGGALAGAGTALAGIFASVTGAVGSLGAALAVAAAPVVLLVGAIGLLVVVLKTLGPAAWESVKMLGVIFEAMIKGIITKLNTLGPQIITSINTAANTVIRIGVAFFTNAGKYLMAGLTNGVASGASAFFNTIVQIITSAINYARSALGIHSPSSVFAEVGKNMMLGMQAGIQEFAKAPINATVNAASAVAPAVSAVRPAGQQGATIGPITIYGDLSASAKERLKEELRVMVNQVVIGGLS